MNKKTLAAVAQTVQMALKKHSPEILTGIGIAGMITSTVLAVRATPKALRLISERERDDWTNLTPLEKVKAAWPCYIPAAVTGGAAVMCLIGASSVNARRNAALATAYAISEGAMREYKGKVIETLGDKKDQAIRDSIAKDKLDQNPVSGREVIVTGRGDTLCYDVISGQYFKSDIDKIKKAENELNKRLLAGVYIPLNDFYYEVGLREARVGDDLGWNIHDGLISLSFSSQLADDGTPCLVIDYSVAPRYDYQSR